MQKHKLATKYEFQRIKTILGFQKLGFQWNSTSSWTRRTFFRDFASEHTIRISKQCTSIIQHPFSLNHANKDESSRNIFTCETSCQHNFQNTQPSSMIRSSKWSAWRDLYKACHDFGNGEIRKLTKFGAQWWNRRCLAVEGWNRCTMLFVLMNGRGILAQKPSRQLQTKSAMEEPLMQQCRWWLYSWDMRLEKGSKRFVCDGTKLRTRVPLEFSVKVQDGENKCF